MNVGRWMSGMLGIVVAVALLGGSVMEANARIKIIAPPGQKAVVAVYQSPAGEIGIVDAIQEYSATGAVTYSAYDVVVERTTGVSYTLIGWVVESAQRPVTYSVIDLNGRAADPETTTAALDRLSSGKKINA